MVKFNRITDKSNFDSDDTNAELVGNDWQQLLVDYQSKPIDETIKDIMEKVIEIKKVKIIYGI